MKLLTETELIWSDVVANNRMNRKRKASGVNSYEKELKFPPEKFLDKAMQVRQQVSWLDICCGEANALLQYAGELADRGIQDRVFLEGIDLVDQFQPIPSHITRLRLKAQPLNEWVPHGQYQLITCVHGSHYIGDKLRVIQVALQAIADDGIFIANLDLTNIKINGDQTGQYLRRFFADNQIDYRVRQKIIQCAGPRKISIPHAYLGADDKAGPNYTGQEAVDSYYA